ncbi:RHS repeat-associated core domain-containing protein [Paenibacillus sp. NPDC055715]
MESSIVKADQVEKTTSFSYGKRVSGSNYDAPEPTTTRTTSNVNGDTLVTNIEYDDYGNVTQSSDETGASTTNTYDDKQRLKTTRESADTNASLYTEFVRNAFGDVTEQTIRRDHAAGELLQHIKYDGIDEYGNVTSQTIYNGDKQITTRTEYDGQYAGAYPTSQSVRVTDADGKKSVVRISSEYELSTGRIIASTDGKNQRTAYQYDVLGRATKVVPPDGNTLEVAYDDDDNSVTVKNEAGVRTRTKWNALGWKTEEGYLNGQDYQIQSKLSYDSFGRLDSSTDALGNITKYFYDNWSRPTETGYADGSISRVLYNDANRTVSRVDAENYQTIETYDMWGRKSKTEEKAPADTTSRLLSKQSYDKINGNVLINWDGNNNKTSYTYDLLRQLNSVTNAKGETTQYSFDLMGNPVAVTYADGSQKRKEFDELGQVIKVTDEKNQISKQYYDENGNLIRRVDRNGQTTRYDYDAHNRLQQRVSKDETVGYTYDATGKRTSMTDSTGITSYQYDPYTEQLVKVIFPDGLHLKNQYDANGNRIKMKEPFGSEVSYTYDTRNRLTSAGTDPSSPDAKYTYYKNGLLEQMIGFNGLKHQFQYAGMDLARLNVNQGEQTVDDFKYIRDGSKNIVKREQKSLVEHEETTDLFQYDVLNRVVDSSEYKASYEYDTRGNRQTLTTERPLKTVPSEYSYDAENRLTQVRKNGKNVQYMYNGDGLLVGRIEGGVQTRYYYDGDQMIAEATVENGTPQLKARYIWGQKLEAIQYADGTKAYPIYNGHGDIVELRDSKGNVLNTYNYDIWGNITSSQEKVYNPFRYSGELWDSTTELQYLRARWYDPDSGRFINEDTYEGKQDDPLSLNLYTYVQNNPLGFVDPSGHEALPKSVEEIVRDFKVITGGATKGASKGSKGGPFGMAASIVLGGLLSASPVGESQEDIDRSKAQYLGLTYLSKESIEKNKNNDHIIYRAINRKDLQRLVNGQDLEAKNPYGLWTLTEHVAWGSKKTADINDPWISTTTNLVRAGYYNNQYGIIAIQRSALTSKNVNALTNLDPKSIDYSRAAAFAMVDKEISVFQYINRNAIIGWMPRY